MNSDCVNEVQLCLDTILQAGACFHERDACVSGLAAWRCGLVEGQDGRGCTHTHANARGWSCVSWRHLVSGRGSAALCVGFRDRTTVYLM